jgi:hypothetical protein
MKTQLAAAKEPQVLLFALCWLSPSLPTACIVSRTGSKGWHGTHTQDAALDILRWWWRT